MKFLTPWRSWQSKREANKRDSEDRIDRMLDVVQQMAETQAAAAAQNAAVMHSFIDLFKPSGMPITRMNGDEIIQWHLAEQRRKMEGTELAPLKGEVDRLKWLDDQISDQVKLDI